MNFTILKSSVAISDKHIRVVQVTTPAIILSMSYITGHPVRVLVFSVKLTLMFGFLQQV